jgi:ribose transport system substrate-binding protein
VSLIVKSKATNFEFWEMVRKGAAEGAKEFGVRLTMDGPENEEDTQGQIDIVKREIERRPDVIVLAAVDQEALLPYAREIMEKGIELVLVDSALSEKVERCFVGTDNVEVGYSVGREMGKRCRARAI